MFANESEHIFCKDYGNVLITLKDLYCAFELGFNTIEEICFVKAKLGSVESVLQRDLIGPQ